MRYYYDYSFPIGNLTIEEDGHGICGIYFGTKMLEGEKKNTELIREAALQLSQYFDGRRKKFDLKLSYHGTEFQIKVWKALEKIPYGETCTYKDIAESVGIPKGCRAVGMANNRNPIVIVVPCHRVIGMNGSLTEEEMAVYKRGRNSKSGSVAKNASMMDYRKATGVEALVGYLYLAGDMDRIIELIGIGFDLNKKEEIGEEHES